MKNTLKFTILILGISLFVGLLTTSCNGEEKKKKKHITENVPSDILPDAIRNDVSELINIYSGDTPPDLDDKDFVSSPHVMVYNSSSNNPDSLVTHGDRYIAFRFSESNGYVYYSKQWDEALQKDIYENVANISVTGSGNNFTYYYVTTGYPDGLFAKQSTIMSGTLTDFGIKDFHVAVILLETSGNPNLELVNSYKVIRDNDGFSEFEDWLNSKSNVNTSEDITDEDIFRLFRK